MDSLRVAPPDSIPGLVSCDRCGGGERRWDRIAGKPFCPNCQELLILGEAPPLVERAGKPPCAVCDQAGTLCYQTFPLQAAAPVEMDLCSEHLRALLSRQLGPHAYHQLRRKLHQVGVSVEDIFLLHGAFYDNQGQALQPANEGAW